jgi:hypothetical protein
MPVGSWPDSSVSPHLQTWDELGSCVWHRTKGQDMKYMIVVLGLIAGFVVVSTVEASAVVCARGAYRAGCVAPRGAVGYRSAAVVRRGAVGYRSATVVRRGTAVRRGVAVRR